MNVSKSGVTNPVPIAWEMSAGRVRQPMPARRPAMTEQMR